MSKDMPIQQKLELRIPLKQSYVLEFPFKIEVKKTPFYAIKTQEKKEIIPKIVLSLVSFCSGFGKIESNFNSNISVPFYSHLLGKSENSIFYFKK